MSAMKNIATALEHAGIDSIKWEEAANSKMDYVDFCLAMDAAEALGFPLLPSALHPLTEERKHDALETARTRWPSL